MSDSDVRYIRIYNWLVLTRVIYQMGDMTFFCNEKRLIIVHMAFLRTPCILRSVKEKNVISAVFPIPYTFLFLTKYETHVILNGNALTGLKFDSEI